MKTKSTLIALLLTVVGCTNSFAGLNCPPDQNTCYFKIIFQKNLGTGDLIEAQRAKVKLSIPSHHDYSIVKVENGSITEKSTRGGFPNWRQEGYLCSDKSI